MIHLELTVREAFDLASHCSGPMYGDLYEKIVKACEVALGPSQTNITVKSIPKDQKIWVIKHIRDAMKWSLADSNDFCKGVIEDGVSDTLVGPTNLMESLAESLRDLGCEIYIDHWGS